MAVKYGIYNAMRKEFQFGISEDSKAKAQRKLFEKIGKDSYKWRFEARALPNPNPSKGGQDHVGLTYKSSYACDTSTNLLKSKES